MRILLLLRLGLRDLRDQLLGDGVAEGIEVLRDRDAREAVDAYLKMARKKLGEFLFTSPRRPGEGMTTRQYARFVFGLDCRRRAGPACVWHASLRRKKATLIYRRTGNLRAVQLLLGHAKIESTVRYLGIEVDDALAIAEGVDI